MFLQHTFPVFFPDKDLLSLLFKMKLNFGVAEEVALFMVILAPKKSLPIFQAAANFGKQEKRGLRFFSFDTWTGYRQEKVRNAAAETKGEEEVSGLLFIVFMILLRPNKMLPFQI